MPRALRGPLTLLSPTRGFSTLSVIKALPKIRIVDQQGSV